MKGDVIKITAVPVGVLPIPGWEAFFGRNDQEFHDLWFYVWHLTDGVRHVLVDTGLPPGAADRDRLDEGCAGVDERCRFRERESLAEVLRLLDLRPDQIDAVVLTQLVTYHTGGLLPEQLPRAKVYLSRAGLVEMLTTAPDHPPVDLYFTGESWSFVRDLAAAGRLYAVDGPVEVVPGISMVATGGHHPGSAAVIVKSSEGIVALLETAFFQENVETGLPIGIAEDVATCRRVIAEFSRMADQVVALHDPANRFTYAPGVADG